MSDRFKFDVHMHSPRWGIDNTYEFHLEQQQMIIGKKADSNPSICTWNDLGKPTWSNHGGESKGQNPFLNTLESELIFPPTVFVRSLEAAWKAWRDGFIDDEQVEFEIGLLCEWVNIVNYTRPCTDFWRRVF